MKQYIRIAGITPHSSVNGDGVRYVIFTQGCVHHCEGCQNPNTWDFSGGNLVSIEWLANEIRNCKYIDGITLSGGDPFFQHDECMKLLDLLPDMNVWVYTGFEYEQIKDKPLAKRADALVVGRYIEALKCEGCMYGSSNQKIIRKDDSK